MGVKTSTRICVGLLAVVAVGAAAVAFWRLRHPRTDPPPHTSQVRFLDPYTRVYQSDDP